MAAMRGVTGLLLLLVSACSLDTGGVATGSGMTTGMSAGSTSRGDPIDTTTGIASGTAGPVLDSSGGGSGSSTSAVSASATSSSTGAPDGSSGGAESSETTSAPPPLFASCAEILADDRNALTGTHTIARADNGLPMDVHCDMDVDDGGWTLVARSEPGASPVPFGWGQSTGTLGDTSAPYSLDVAQVGPAFTEILIARRAQDFATPSMTAYVIEVPDTFIADYGQSAYDHMSTRTVIGSCNPTDGPEMLRWVGHTELDDAFFFRDFADTILLFGLFRDGLETYYSNCSQGGDLDEHQGVLYVR